VWERRRNMLQTPQHGFGIAQALSDEMDDELLSVVTVKVGLEPPGNRKQRGSLMSCLGSTGSELLSEPRTECS